MTSCDFHECALFLLFVVHLYYVLALNLPCLPCICVVLLCLLLYHTLALFLVYA